MRWITILSTMALTMMPLGHGGPSPAILKAMEQQVASSGQPLWVDQDYKNGRRIWEMAIKQGNKVAMAQFSLQGKEIGIKHNFKSVEGRLQYGLAHVVTQAETKALQITGGGNITALSGGHVGNVPVFKISIHKGAQRYQVSVAKETLEVLQVKTMKK